MTHTTTSVREAFAEEEKRRQSLTMATEARNQVLAPVVIAVKACFPWATVPEMTKEDQKRHGWSAHGYCQSEPMSWSAGMRDNDHVTFFFQRRFEGNHRWGYGDLHFEFYVEVPIEMIEMGNLEVLTAFIQENGSLGEYQT